MAGLVLPAFDYAAAWTMGAALRDLAAAEQVPVGIEVCHGATPVFLSLMPGATPDNIDWLRRKRAVALRFHKPSLYLRLHCEARGIDFHDRYGLSPLEYACSGGAVPIQVRGSGVVGVATISGLPDVQDHALVLRVLSVMAGSA